MTDVANVFTDENTFYPFYIPEIELSKESKLFRKLVKEYGLTNNIMRAANNWEETGILNKILEARNVILPFGTVTFTNAKISKPTYNSHAKLFPLTPTIARNKNLNYSGLMTVTLKFTPYPDKASKNPAFEVNNITFGKVPIFLGTRYCHLYGKTPKEIIEMGECPNDPFGYNIIKGTEKIIITQEKLRSQQIIAINDSKGIIECRMYCYSLTGSTQTTLLKGKKWPTIKASLAHSKTKHIPIFVLFYFLGFDLEDSINMILSYVKKENRNSVYFSLQPSIASYNSNDPITYWKNKRELSTTNMKEAIRQMVNDINKDLFSNIESVKTGLEPGDEQLYEKFVNKYIQNKGEDFIPIQIQQIDKAKQLAFMTARMAETIQGLRPFDDRDSLSMKRLEIGPLAYILLFIQLYSQLIEDIQKHVNEKKIDEKEKFNVNTYMNYIKIVEKIITDQSAVSFNSKSWGASNSKKKENITDTLKRENNIALYSIGGKINIPYLRQGASRNVRSLKGSQVGRICIGETPEGENCGLVQNFASNLYISLENEIDKITDLLKGYSENDPPYALFDNDSNDDFPYVFTINGKIHCWVKYEIINKLIDDRRSQKLPFDACICFNEDNNSVEYFCNSSRPCRPLLIMENGELLIDKYDLWDRPLEELYKKKVIEMIDIREEELMEYYVSSSPEKARNRAIEIKALEKLVKIKSKERIKEHDIDDDTFKMCIKLFEIVGTIKNADKVLKTLHEFSNKYEKPENLEIFRQEHINDSDIKYGVNIINQYFLADFDSLKIANDFEEFKTSYDLIIEEIYILKEYDNLRSKPNFTHCQISPLSAFGISCGLMPNANSNQGARVSYQGSMGKQASTDYHTNHHYRMNDAGYKILVWPTRSPWESEMAEPTGFNIMPAGKQLLVAYASEGNNMEDATIWDKDILDNMEIAKYHVIEVKVISQQHLFEQIGFKIFGMKSEENSIYHAIDDYGFPKIGSYLKKGDCVLFKQKCLEFKPTENDKTECINWANTNKYVGIGEDGYVERIYVDYDGTDTSTICVKIKVGNLRKQIVADKLATRYAQKTTVAEKRESYHMPYISEGPNKGVRPHVLIHSCLTGDMPVTTYYGVSKRLDSLTEDYANTVWGYDKEKNGFTSGKQFNLQSMGRKNILEITMIDGRKIKCTGDHKILTVNENNEKVYKRADKLIAKYLLNDETKLFEKVNDNSTYLVMGPEGPLDIPNENDINWELQTSDFLFKMDTDLNREKTLAFVRLIGLVSTDGWIGENNQSKTLNYTSQVYLGSTIDVEMCLRDIEIITHKRPKVIDRKGNDDNVLKRCYGDAFVICLPVELSRSVASVGGMLIGKKTTQCVNWPSFLFDDNCPQAVIREFLGGLFGGDGLAPSLCKHTAKCRKAKSELDRYTFENVRFLQTCIKSLSEPFIAKMEQLVLLIKKVGVNDVIVKPPSYVSYGGETEDRIICGVELGASLNSCLEFSDKIGFRYCTQKLQRLSAATSYFRFIENVKRQHNLIVSETDRKIDEGTETINNSLLKTKNEMLLNEAPLNEYYSLPNDTIIRNRRKSTGRQKTLMKLDYTRIMDPETFLNQINCLDWFMSDTMLNKTESENYGHPNYISDRYDMHIPEFKMEILSIRKIGKDHVYDITVEGIHNFLVHGVSVSNCSSISRMTQGMMKEILCSKAALYNFERINATTFLNIDMNKYENVLEENGLDRYGREKMCHPDGTPLQCDFYFGVCTYQALRHHVLDKVQVRDTGVVKPISRQPTSGRDREGGIRIGEMEKDALEEHGGSALVLERLMVVSDLYSTVYCSNCGNIAIFDIKAHTSKCKCTFCPEENSAFGNVNIPYIYISILRYLQAIGISCTFNLKKIVNSSGRIEDLFLV